MTKRNGKIIFVQPFFWHKRRDFFFLLLFFIMQTLVKRFWQSDIYKSLASSTYTVDPVKFVINQCYCGTQNGNYSHQKVINSNFKCANFVLGLFFILHSLFSDVLIYRKITLIFQIEVVALHWFILCITNLYRWISVWP